MSEWDLCTFFSQVQGPRSKVKNYCPLVIKGLWLATMQILVLHTQPCCPSCWSSMFSPELTLLLSAQVQE